MEGNDNICRWFIFYRDCLLLEREGATYVVPYRKEIPVPVSAEVRLLPVTTVDGIPSVTCSIEKPIDDDGRYLMVGLRASYDYLEKAVYQSAGKAFQIMHWDKNSRYCPACGVQTVLSTPISKVCPSCKQELYPVIATAIIVLIRKGDSVLLVHARNFKGSFYGLVAGFLEAGETLEECVKREVMEETGLTIRNITYFGNQSWPYPSGLMVGFIADYECGEIKLQEEELSAGAFYTKENLPEIPRKLSLARKMIDWWLESQGKRLNYS